MTNHVGDVGDAGDVIGVGVDDKKSHYTALLVGVLTGAMTSAFVLVAVAIATSV